MAHNRAHSTTPILDCIEVAGSANDSRSGIYDSSDKYQEFEAMSDSNDSFDPRDTTLLDSLDGGSTARARFHLSPDKSNSISNKPSRLQTAPIARDSENKAITMQPESKPKSRELMKRDRPRSSSANESPRKKRKSAETSKKDSLRLGPPVAHVSLPNVKPTKDDLKAKTIKPSRHKSEISIRTTNIKPSPPLPVLNKSIKPDPQPIRSDLLHPKTSKRAKPSPTIDLTGDTSDEQSEEQKSDFTLQRQLDERISEVRDYQDSLRRANSKIQELQRNELLRKAAEQGELEERKEETVTIETALQNAKEKNDQLVKDNSDLEKQAEEHKVAISRLQTESAELKEELEDQKYATDWYKAKFLKFKAGYNELKKETEEKADILCRMLPAICSVVGMPFDQTRPVEDEVAVADQTENDSPADNIGDGPLVPAREDGLNEEAQDNAAK